MNERWKETYDQWKTDAPSITEEQERELEREDEENPDPWCDDCRGWQCICEPKNSSR